MDKAVTLLQELIRIDSANDHEEAVAAVLRRELEAAGIAVTMIPYAPGRVNLVAEFGTGEEILTFAGHLDVVAPGDPSKWRFPPFGGTIAGDTLYGRGAADMKAGLAAMVLALIRLKQAGFNHHIRFLASVGEEYGAPGSRQLTELGYVDDIKALVVGEPTANTIEYAHAGSYNYKIKSYGHSVHSSVPATGVNAITKLVDFAVAERRVFDTAPKDPVIGPLVHSVTMLAAGEQVNTLPDYAELAGNIRPTASFTNQEVTATLTDLVATLNQTGPGRLEFELTHSFFPVSTPTDSPLVQAAQDALTKVHGAPLPLGISHGATDASEYTKSTHPFDVIIYGPGNEGQDTSHQIDERINITRYRQAIDDYEELAKRYFEKRA